MLPEGAISLPVDLAEEILCCVYQREGSLHISMFLGAFAILADLLLIIEVVVNCLQKLPHFGCQSTDLADIWWTFDHYLGNKSIKVLAKSIHRYPRKCESNAILRVIHANLN